METKKEDIKKGPWKAEEDEVLINHVKKYGPRDWSSIRSKGQLQRTGKSCRLRWVNKLRPNLKNGCKFSIEEERVVIELQAQFGNKWAKIATFLPGRTDNDVKNFWSSRQKRLARILHSSTPKSHKFKREILEAPTTFTLSMEEESSSFQSSYAENPMMALPEEMVKPDLLGFDMNYFLNPNEKTTCFVDQPPQSIEDPYFVDVTELGNGSPFFDAIDGNNNNPVSGPFSFFDDFPVDDVFDQLDKLPSPPYW